MNIRRLLAFVALLPSWPFAVVAAMLDDEAEVSDVLECIIGAFRRIYEK